MTFPSRPRSPERAVTLLELVLVLTILVALSTVALTSVAGRADQSKYQATQRTLETVEEAIVGPNPLQGADASFVGDLGRLPFARPGDEDLDLDGTPEAVVTAAELWDADLFPNEEQQYALRQAIQANGVAAADEDPGVWIGTGWRGPYLRLPVGASALRDGWGRPLVSSEGGAPGECSLFQPDGTPANEAGEPVAQVRSLGGDNALGGGGFDRDLSSVLASPGRWRAGLVVSALDPFFSPGDQITIRVYGPDPDNPGQVRAFSRTVPLLGGSATVVFQESDGLAAGPRMVRARIDARSTGNNASAPLPLDLKPGVNQIEISIDRRFPEQSNP